MDSFLSSVRLPAFVMRKLVEQPSFFFGTMLSMDQITQHAMNYAIRSGIAITSGYAIQQCSQFLKTIKSHERKEIAVLKTRLENKIRIISPAIDMIELIAARGNTSLDSAVALTKSIRVEIQSLGMQMAKANKDQVHRQRNVKSKAKVQEKEELQHVILALKSLLTQIEDAVPLINLAIATSGVSLSTALPSTVSPSRLLQASMFLSTADSAYAANPGIPMQVGPSYTLSIYMLFDGHANRQHDKEGIRETTWQEVIHKARVKLVRTPLNGLDQIPKSAHKTDEFSSPSSIRRPEECSPRLIPSDSEAHEFAYQLLVVEDLDDGRVHTVEEDDFQPGQYEDVALAGIREVIPIHEISKIFYADTGKILNINADGESNNPVLLLKRDIGATPPRRMMENRYAEQESEIDSDDQDSNSKPPTDSFSNHKLGPQAWKFPSSLDLSWIAFEVYTDVSDSDEDDDSLNELEEMESNSNSPDIYLPVTPAKEDSTGEKSSEKIRSKSKQSMMEPSARESKISQLPMPSLRTSLSLLEVLIRLSSLQQFQQCSHLAISDELLNFFLSESSSTGAGADSERRKNMRTEARRRLGFDPYAESPLRFRGEGNWNERDNTAQEEHDDDDDNELPPLRSISQIEHSHHGMNPSSIGFSRFSPSFDSSPRIHSSPSMRAENRFASQSSKTDRAETFSDNERRLPNRLGRKTFQRYDQLLRSESDSTLGTSPGDALARHDN